MAAGLGGEDEGEIQDDGLRDLCDQDGLDKHDAAEHSEVQVKQVDVRSCSGHVVRTEPNSDRGRHLQIGLLARRRLKLLMEKLTKVHRRQVISTKLEYSLKQSVCDRLIGKVRCCCSKRCCRCCDGCCCCLLEPM